jgi:hypothetical protein
MPLHEVFKWPQLLSAVACLYRWQLRKWPLHTRRVSRITVKALVTSNIIQSLCLVGKGRLKERCGLEPRTDFFFHFRNRQKLVRIRFENIRYTSLWFEPISNASFTYHTWSELKNDDDTARGGIQFYAHARRRSSSSSPRQHLQSFCHPTTYKQIKRRSTTNEQ